MERREFLNMGLLSVGGVLIGPEFTYAETLKEISDSLHNTSGFYDLVINGAGMAGFYAAIEASKRGLKVLILDKRTSPGFDIAGKRRLWLNTNGIREWDDAMIDLFCPEGERNEIGEPALSGVARSCYKNELLLFAGSLKKGMLRSLLVNGIDVLLMTDIWGVVVDNQNQVCGVTIASKHGLYFVSCGSFLDVSDGSLFTRGVLGLAYEIKEAGFVVELEGVSPECPNILSVDTSWGISDNCVKLHKGKKFPDQYLLEFRFRVSTNDLSCIERQARLLAAEIGKRLPELSPFLSESKIRYWALESSLSVVGDIDETMFPKGYHMFTAPEIYTDCEDLSSLYVNMRKVTGMMPRYHNDRKGKFVIYVGGKTVFACGDVVREDGFKLPLYDYIPKRLSVTEENVPLLIAGGGTAGTAAALGAMRKGMTPLVVEYFNDLGGTKTVGGVSSYYFGFKDHKLIKELEVQIKSVADTYHLKTTIPRSFYFLKKLSEAGNSVIHGAIVCNVSMKGRSVDSVLLCENGRLRRIFARLVVDATGDGDIAYFAGAKYKMGDSRMGITQNYSHWDIPFRAKVKNYNRDDDIIDNTLISEVQRGLYLSHYESHFYDFYPMLAVRESRRPDALHCLSIVDIVNKSVFPDTIVQSRSDYDPHYFSSSELSRCAFLLPHFDNGSRVNIPYRCIVPKEIDGLLLSGKAIGQTYKGLQFTRMSADVTVLGYVSGMIAADIVKTGVRPRDFVVNDICKELKAIGYLSDDVGVSRTSDTNDIINQLLAGNNYSWLSCCLQNRAEILPLLKKEYQLSKALVLAKALAWFGDCSGTKQIRDELEYLYEQELIKGHSSAYYEEYDGTNLYWHINQDIALLGMSGDRDNHIIVGRILSGTTSGGRRVPAKDAYNEGRIDLQLIPYYNRIINLCFYAERNPSHLFIHGFEKLLDDVNIGGFKTTCYKETRWRLYSANLELFIAAALARCGSVRGIQVLLDYLDDIHSDFRRFARKELFAILKKDCEYDIVAWKRQIDKQTFPLRITPLVKDIEI